MLDRRKKGKQRKGGTGIVPPEPPVWSALERAGWVVVMGAKPGESAEPSPGQRVKRPR